LAALTAFVTVSRESASYAPERTARNFIGEQLVYKIQWDPPWYLFFLPAMEAGEVELQLNGEKEYNGRKVLEVRLKGRSSGNLVKMAGMKIEDEFVFLTEPESFCTLSSSSRIREGKRKRQVDVQYLGATRQLHIREMDEADVPPKLKKDETKNGIPECVHDPLSALYLFRESSLREGYAQNFILANDDKIKEVKALVEKQEIIQGPAGKTAAWRVTPTALMGGLFKEGGQFRIWLSADEKKVPLQFEVKVKLGRIFGRLKPTR
jgi:hypothetical protein